MTWLSKRLGTEVKPPSLKAAGYELIGGRLLPGDTGPVAQFTYHDSSGQRLTLYVTREVPKVSSESQTAFRFGIEGPVNVFYWVDKNFGHAVWRIGPRRADAGVERGLRPARPGLSFRHAKAACTNSSAHARQPWIPF